MAESTLAEGDEHETSVVFPIPGTFTLHDNGES